MTIADLDPAALWLAAGLALGIAELLVPGVFLVFLAMAAGVTALTAWAIPELPFGLQLAEFAVWSVACVMIGRRWYRDFPVESDAPVLNAPTLRLRGQIVTVRGMTSTEVHDAGLKDIAVDFITNPDAVPLTLSAGQSKLGFMNFDAGSLDCVYAPNR